MKKLLVCQHVPFEILGTLNPLLKSAGLRIQYVNFGRYPDARPDLSGYDGLVILGGPMNVGQVDDYPHLATELEMVRQALVMDIPTLGICLGAQLIAKALGAQVMQNPVKEIGWYDVSVTREGKTDPLFAHFRETEKIFQWHSDTFEIPEGGVHLAESPTCRHQAFRVGKRVYGFQFHMEVDERLIERWLKVPVHKAEIRSTAGEISVAGIRAGTPVHLQRLRDLSAATFGRFIEFFGLSEKSVMLRSQ